MNGSDLLKYLEGRVEDDEFRNSISKEICSYKNSKEKKKGVSDIYGDHSNRLFSNNDLIELLNKYLSNKIFEWDLEYLLCFIDFCFLEKDNRTEEVIFSLSDPYLNFPITMYNVKNALGYLIGDESNLKLLNSHPKEIRPNYRARIDF